MDSIKRRISRRATAILLVMLMITTTLTPLGSVLSVSAATYSSGNVCAENLVKDDIIKEGVRVDWAFTDYASSSYGLIVVDNATNNEIYHRTDRTDEAFTEIPAWTADKDYVVVSNTSDSDLYNTLRVKADGSAYTQSGDWWGLTSDGTLELFGNLPNLDYNTGIPWYGNSNAELRNSIKKVVALEGAKANQKFAYVFRDCQNLTEADLTNLDTSAAQSFYSLFYGCKNMESVALNPQMVTANTTEAAEMFFNCEKLATPLDLRQWDTSNLGTISDTFRNCKALPSVKLSGWSLPKLYGISDTFNGCESIEELDFTGWNPTWDSFKYNLNSTFAGMTNLKKINFGSWAFTSYASNTFNGSNNIETLIVPEGTTVTDYNKLVNTAGGKHWYNEAGEIVGGDAQYAVISGQSGTLRRLGDITVDDIDPVMYTGEALEPTITVRNAEGTELTLGTDYTVAYSDNVDMGTGKVTVTGLNGYAFTEKEFDIYAALDRSALSDNITVDVFDAEGNPVDFEDDKAPIAKDYTVKSSAELTFDGAKPTVYEPAEEDNPYPDYYTYELTKKPTKPTVTLTHGHKYNLKYHKNEETGNTDTSRLDIGCTGETSDYETIAELTISDHNYEYGDKVSIENKKYSSDTYGVEEDDVTFVKTLFQRSGSSSADEDTPTELGDYSVLSAVHVAQSPGTDPSLHKNFTIGKKDIANLLNVSDPTKEKNDHIEVTLTPAEGDAVSGVKVTYDGKLYTPSIKLVNYVYDYTTQQYVEEVLQENVDYTATLTPKKNANTYTITITAVETSEHYKNSGTYDWTIDKRSFVNLALTDTRTDDEKIYNGQPVADEKFEVTGIDDAANLGLDDGTDITYKYFKLNDGVTVPTNIQDLTADQFTELTSAPKNKGIYRVEATVVDKPNSDNGHNYNEKKVAINFEIKQRTATVAPKDTNNITYGEFVKVDALAYDLENVVEGDTIAAEDVVLKVIRTNAPTTYVGKYDLLNAGSYDYELVEGTAASNPNYRLVLKEDAKLTVAKKALTADMFTVTGEFVYDKREHQATVTADDTMSYEIQGDPDTYETPIMGSYQLIADTDWTIVDNTDKGTNANSYVVKVSATEDGNYTGTIELTDQPWTISPKSITHETVKVKVTNDKAVYTGSEIEADIVVTDSENVPDGQDPTVLVKDTDYTIVTAAAGEKYTDAQPIAQINAGKYTFYVVGKGNYKDDRPVTWSITLKITGRKVWTYDGKSAEGRYKVSGAPSDYDGNYVFYYKEQTQGDDAWTTDAPINFGDYQVKAVGETDENLQSLPFDFTIKKRAIELYPNEDQKFEYGSTREAIEEALNNVENFEVENAEEGSITGLVSTDNKAMFCGIFKVADDFNGNIGDYDIVIDPEFNTGNYVVSYAVDTDATQFEVTKAKIKHEWFEVVVTDEDAEASATDFSGNVKTATIKKTTLAPEDVTFGTSGTFKAYLPEDEDASYVIYVKGTGNYTGKEEYTWNINPVELDAKTIMVDEPDVYIPVEPAVDPATGDEPATSDEPELPIEPASEPTGRPGYIYDGTAPRVDIVNNDGSDLPELAEKVYTYTKLGETDALVGAPVTVGDYTVQGSIDCKGYKATVSSQDYSIVERPVIINVNEEDLIGYYDPKAEYTIGYTVAEYDKADKTGIIPTDAENGVKVTGTLVITENSVGTHTIDFSGLKVVNANGEVNKNYVIAEGEAELLVKPRPLKDENIVLNEKYTVTDLGQTDISFAVKVNGVTLVEGIDYIVAGAEATDEPGEYNVQVKGIGNYTGFAEAVLTVAVDEETKAAAVEDIKNHISVGFADAVTAKSTNGTKKVTATAESGVVVADGELPDKYHITRTGVVYYTGTLTGDEMPALTRETAADADDVADKGKNNSETYTYAMPVNTNGTVTAVAYAVANDGAYEAVVYSQAPVTYVYDEIVEYTVTTENGIIRSEQADTMTYHGTDVNNKLTISIEANAAEEGMKFAYWEKDETIVNYNPVYTFYASAKNETYTAVFVPESEEIDVKGTTYMDSITPKVVDGKKKIAFVTMSSIPEDATLLNAGLVFTINEAVDENTLTAANYPANVRGKSGNYTAYRYTWTKSYTDGEVYYVRAYVKYQTAEGEIEEAYGDVYKVTFEGFELVK